MEGLTRKQQALDLWTSTTTNAAMTSLIKDLPSSFAAYTADATYVVLPEHCIAFLIC